MVVSGQETLNKLNLFDSKATNDKIEVRDGERPVFSPQATGVAFLKGLNSVFDWNPDALELTERDSLHFQTSAGQSSGRPNSQRQTLFRKSPRATANRTIRLKDELAS